MKAKEASAIAATCRPDRAAVLIVSGATGAVMAKSLVIGKGAPGALNCLDRVFTNFNA